MGCTDDYRSGMIAGSRRCVTPGCEVKQAVKSPEAVIAEQDFLIREAGRMIRTIHVDGSRNVDGEADISKNLSRIVKA
jgi:hypothetical protein